MADESPVMRTHHPRQFNIGTAAVDRSSDHILMSEDDDLSVGGTTPPPAPVAAEFKDEQSDDKDSVMGGPSHSIKFSIDNILNPDFGRMSAAESAMAAVALQQQMIQQHRASPAGFLGAFHQLPFLAAARQMILAASSVDYQHHLAMQHPVNSLLLAQHHHHPGGVGGNTLNLVQSCTDKYLGSGGNKQPSWSPHQPALPGGTQINKPIASSTPVGNLKSKAQHVKKPSAPLSNKAIDLSVRNSASPPDNHRHRSGGEIKPSVPQASPSLAGSSNDDTSSASPARSASVGGSTCSAGNGESGGPGSTGGGQAAASGGSSGEGANKEPLWPAWVYCTRYSDRPSSGPRARRIRTKKDRKAEEKRPRTAFTSEQLARLKAEFTENRYLTEKRRQDLARELQLHENQIKIWFQNKRAKIKKASGQKNPLALQLMAQGLYNHSTMALDEDEEDDDEDLLSHPE